MDTKWTPTDEQLDSRFVWATMPGGRVTDPAEAAAWVGLGSVLLNLDEFITRE